MQTLNEAYRSEVRRLTMFDRHATGKIIFDTNFGMVHIIPFKQESFRQFMKDTATSPQLEHSRSKRPRICWIKLSRSFYYWRMQNEAQDGS